MQIPYILTNVDGVQTITLYPGGVPTPVDQSHPAFDTILEKLDTITTQELRELLDTSRRVRRALQHFGNVKVDGDTVFYKGEAVHGLLADRMIQMLEDGMDIRPWALFLENLKQNPAKHAVDELYGWLEHSNMPITERGNFLAYKKVNDDYTSFHRNPDGSEFRNDIGTFVSMERNKVDDDRHRTCSSGLHFCSWDYLGSYYGNCGKVVLLEVNPAHVVSIPTDYNNAKGRAEGYLIVGEIPQEECEHAFPGMGLVTFDDSPYITYRVDGDIDYSSIEDGWYDDYKDLDLDELDEACYEAYQLGRAHATDDVMLGNPFDFWYVSGDFDTLEEWENYCDGYGDEYYGLMSEDDEDEEFDIDDLFDDFQETVEEMWAEANADRVTPENWSNSTVANKIRRGELTLGEFISNYNPTQWDVIDVVDKLR